MEETIKDEWKGAKGKFNAWFFSTCIRRFIENIFFGNYRPEFNKEVEIKIKTGGEVILDIGAGSGHLSIPIARKLLSGKVIALDPSTVMTDFLQKRAKRRSLTNKIEVINKSAFKTGLPNDSVDWCVSSITFHELKSPELAMSEIYRVLRPGGSIFIVDFKDKHGYDEGGHGPYSKEQMTELLNSINAKEVKVVEKRHFIIATAQK